MSKRKIKSNKEKSSANILGSKSELHGLLKENVIFSFKYLENNELCSFKNSSDLKYLDAFLERLKSVSQMTMNDFRNKYSKSLRNHIVNWEETNCDSFGLPYEDQLVDEPFQFSISANRYGRIFGFIIENTFYIRWIDHEHNVYSL